MAEWLTERGIGEIRMALVENDEILEARILLDGVVAAGTVLDARLLDVGRDGRGAIAEKDGTEYLIPVVPPGLAEGERIRIEVTREAIPGAEPWKRPLARVAAAGSHGDACPPSPTVPFPSPHDLLQQAGWLDLLDEARSGIVRFPGGELRVSPTPAMTLIDVDGHIPPFELALAGARSAAAAVRRHGIGGSIGIDFPTVEGKAERLEIAGSIDAVLPQPFERTAVNGFGFLQIVRPRRHASLFELAADRAAFEARALMRQAAIERIGAITLVAHPAVLAVLEQRPEWLEQLGRQVGGAVGLRAEPGLPISGAYAESA